MTDDQFLTDLLALPVVQTAKLSPDRRWVAFVWNRYGPRDVWVVPTDGSQAPFALTETPEQTALISWTPDSTAVIVGEDHHGDERVRLLRVALDKPKSMEALTAEHPPYFMDGGELHPDGHTLFYGINYDLATEQTIEPTWIYRHDLRTGQRVPIACPVQPSHTAPQLNRQGTHLLYRRSDLDPGGLQLYLVGSDGQSDHEIVNCGAAAKVDAHWFPDGERILVVSDSRDSKEQQHKSVGIYVVGSGQLHWVLDDPGRSIERAWVEPGGAIVVDEVIEARHRPAVLDPQTGTLTPLPELGGNIIPVGRAVDGAWIAFWYGADAPTQLISLAGDGDSAAPVVLTPAWDQTALTSNDLVRAEDLRWRSDDGLEIQGWLYRAVPNARRAIIHIHGGPTSHSEDRYNPQIQYLVRHGFNVLEVNYRGSTGFGVAFRDAIKVDGWGGREQTDIAAGARALIAAGLAAPGRVGVTGTSYGGYSSWFLITHEPPETIAAAVPICGMTDLVVDYETTRPDLRPYSAEMMGGTPDERPDRYYERSPINFVSNIRGRVLIVQGARDPNVTPQNVNAVVSRLDAEDIPYELCVFDDEGHGIGRPANRAVLARRLVTFFDGTLPRHA